MSSIILKANEKLNGGYDTSKYWNISSGSSSSSGSNLYVGVTTDYANRRSRITFFPNSSIFADQTIKAVTLTLKVRTLFSSEAKTQDTNIKISATNEDSNTAYEKATLCGTLSAKKEGEIFTFNFSGDSLELINNYCKNGTQFSIYFGIDSNEGKYGLQYYGFSVSGAPFLTIEYQPSASTGTISNNPKIGSPFTVYINKVDGTRYTHIIKISSSISDTSISSDMLSTDIISKNFTISAANTLDWISSSATSQRANCLIETYSDGTKIGNYSFEFVLSIADILDVTWNTYSITATSNINSYNYLISGQNYPIVNLKATATNGSTITKYRLEINSCGVVLNKTYNATSGSLSVTLNDIKAPYTSSDANFIIHAYAINSLGVESSFKEISKLCYAYALPSTILNPIRASDEKGTEDINGTYIYNNTELNYTSINGQNSITKVTVKIEDTIIKDEDNPQSLTFYKSGASTENEYNITVTIKDRVSENTIKAKIPSSNFLIHIKKGGKSIGIGSAAGDDETIKLGWKLLVKKGIEFYDTNGNLIPLPPASGGTGVSSIEGLKEILGINNLNYLQLSGGTLSGNLSINGALSTTDSNKAITLTGNNFTYNGGDVLVLNKNVFYSSEEPSNPSIGTIWLKI